MKNKLKLIISFFAVIISMASCMPVQEALKNNSSSRTANTRSKKPSSSSSNSKNNSSSASSSSTANSSADAVYTNSKNYLKKQNTKLTDYCISWIGTPHVLGGNTRKGVDCSGFVYNVYKDVYDIILPRRSADMESEVNLLNSISKLKEGDLVFFGKNSVNHVGIFLDETNFIHTSSSKGVIVSSLEEKYWKENLRSYGHHPKVKN